MGADQQRQQGKEHGNIGDHDVFLLDLQPELIKPGEEVGNTAGIALGRGGGLGFLLLALILWFWYPLHKHRVDQNVEILREKHEKQG